jgi:hypothetical protein
MQSDLSPEKLFIHKERKKVGPKKKETHCYGTSYLFSLKNFPTQSLPSSQLS